MDLPSIYFSSLLFLEWSLPSPFIDARGTQGYMHVLRDIFPRKEDLRHSLSLTLYMVWLQTGPIQELAQDKPYLEATYGLAWSRSRP
jgi:hypothetical protein